MSERVEIEVDAATSRMAAQLRAPARTSTSAAAAAQLRALALADASNRIDAWHADHPRFLDDAEPERRRRRRRLTASPRAAWRNLDLPAGARTPDNRRCASSCRPTGSTATTPACGSWAHTSSTATPAGC